MFLKIFEILDPYVLYYVYINVLKNIIMVFLNIGHTNIGLLIYIFNGQALKISRDITKKEVT